MNNNNVLYKILLFALFFSRSVSLIAQTSPVMKSWEGSLKISKSDSLKVVLTLQFLNDSLVGAEFDSPDQYSFGIKASSYKIKNDTLKVVSKQLAAYYIAVLQKEGSYSGVFTQRNNKFPLDLFPISERPTLKRPQEPNPPYNYTESELIIKDDYGATLINGTLTFPSKPLKGTIILVSGSGWQDRDETIFGHKPFKVIADYLTKEGYAVYRYDDRNTALFEKSTTFDFVDDVQRIVTHFKNNSLHKNAKIGLIGHSEGGLVAFIAAAENNDIDFIISMAGCAETFEKVLLFQAEISAKSEGYSKKEIEETLEISSKIYKMLSKEDSSSVVIEKYKKIVSGYTKNMTPEQRKKYNLTDFIIIQQSSVISSPWFMTLFKIYPEKYIKKIECPVYAINGEKDMQVNYATHLPIIKKYVFKKSSLNKVESFKNLNHLFQECETGMFDEYGRIEQTISPNVLNSMLLWLNSVCDKK